MVLGVNDDRDCSRATLGLLKRGNNMNKTLALPFVPFVQRPGANK